MNILKYKFVIVIVLANLISAQAHAMNNECTQAQLDRLKGLQDYWDHAEQLFTAEWGPKSSVAANAVEKGMNAFQPVGAAYIQYLEDGSIPNTSSMSGPDLWSAFNAFINRNEIDASLFLLQTSRAQVPHIAAAVQACERSLSRTSGPPDDNEPDVDDTVLPGGGCQSAPNGGQNCPVEPQDVPPNLYCQDATQPNC